MLKKLLMLWIAFALSIGAAFAAVDVNTADQTALESVKGLGPVKSKAIIDERTKNGPFKDADDLATRVKGLGTKSVTNLEQAGLTVGGSSAPPTGTKPSRSSSTSSNAGTSAAPANSTVKSSTAATAATSPAATTATTPAATPDAASTTKGSKKSRKAAKAAAAASGAAPAAPATADSASAASGTKAGKKSKKKKAASDAAAT